MIEGHTLEFHIQELVHRKLAARVGEADDYPIDRAGADNRRDIVHGAYDAGIDHGLPDLAGVGIDESDDLDTQLVPPLEKLAREVHRRNARSDEKKTLTRA